MTGQQPEGTPRPWRLTRQYGSLAELEAGAGRGPRPMLAAGQLMAVRPRTPLTMMPARGSRHGEPTDVTDDALARVRAYMAEAHAEYGTYAAERDAARERRDR
jgi:hypothetical protein